MSRSVNATKTEVAVTAVARSSEDIRDRIIQSYRDEIKVQPQRERDYRHLTDLIGDLQRRIKSLEGCLGDS